MSEDPSKYSLDGLRVEEEELRPPALLPISVLTSETELIGEIKNVVELTRRIESELRRKYAFQRPERKKFKEGFLEFDNSSGNIIQCY
jgi:hypothetical protein